MPLNNTGRVVQFSFTTNDSSRKITEEQNIYLRDVNIHIYGANVYYGDGDAVKNATQGAGTPDCAYALANSVLTFENLRLDTIFFKNAVNATNAYVTAVGTLIEVS